jgi:transposase InsO family protein
MSSSSRLVPGATFQMTGSRFKVIGRSGADGDFICRRFGSMEELKLSAHTIVSAKDFRRLDIEPDNGEPTPVMFDLPDRVFAEAQERLFHIQEATTGYRLGDPSLALPGEPRDEYAPHLTQRQRFANKVHELRAQGIKCSIATLYNWRRQQSEGTVGLADKRKIRPSDPLGRCSPEVREAITAVWGEAKTRARKLKKFYRIDVIAYLEEKYPDRVIKVPPERTFNRYWDQLTKPEYTSTGAMKYVRSRVAGPKSPYGEIEADRPGQFVLIDESRANIMVYDDATLRVIRPHLILAQDADSRVIPSIEVTASRPNRHDAQTVLADILMPKPWDPDWGPEARWAYLGIPENIVVALTGSPFDALASIPVIQPQQVLTDNAWIYKALTYRQSASDFGYDLQYARAWTPTDKAALERTFKSLDESFFASLPGYTGRDVHSGADSRGEARLFLSQLKPLAYEWIAKYWNIRHHEGLYFGSAPKLDLTPHEAFEEGCQRGGWPMLPTSADRRYTSMPQELSPITREGISVRNLTYDCEALDEYGLRNKKSPYPIFAGQWPIRFEKHDLSHIYVNDPETGTWIEAPWVRANSLNRAFSRDERDSALNVLRKRGKTPPTDERVERYLVDLAKRRAKLLTLSPKEVARMHRALGAEAVELSNGHKPSSRRNGHGAITTPKPPAALTATNGSRQKKTSAGRKIAAFPTLVE